jgi:hypothetical protein
MRMLDAYNPRLAFVYQQPLSVYVCSRGVLLAYGLGAWPRIPFGSHWGLWSSIARCLKDRNLFGSVFGIHSSFFRFDHRWLQPTIKSHPNHATQAPKLVLTSQAAYNMWHVALADTSASRRVCDAWNDTGIDSFHFKAGNNITFTSKHS